MSQYYPIPQPTIANNILVRRERRLPVPGEVLVKAGQRVEPSDIIAQSTIASEPVRVDIASALEMSPAAAARRLLVSPGAEVAQGDVLAQKGGTGSRSARSPVTGVFAGYDPDSGTGLINTPAEPVTVRAHLKGIVTDLVPYYGAIVETPATLVRGIFGIGGEQHGVLKVGASSGDEQLTPDMVDARFTYSIVLAGGELTVDTLYRLIEQGARGVIAGSIRSSEMESFLGMRGPHDWALGASTGESAGWDFPPPVPGMAPQVPPDFVVIVTEGFGNVPMTPRTFELIAAYDGQEIAIDGTTRLRGSLARPEVLIPLARTTAVRFLEEKGPTVEVGTNVRLLSPSYLGQMAQVTGLPRGPRTVQSGVVAPVADVQLFTGQKLRVPLVDLEVLE
jgi:hypothetical protein